MMAILSFERKDSTTVKELTQTGATEVQISSILRNELANTYHIKKGLGILGLSTDEELNVLIRVSLEQPTVAAVWKTEVDR